MAAWSGGVFLVLYLVAFALVMGIQSRSGRRDLQVTLYSQAEALATYNASTDRLDYPELRQQDESTPFPVFLRVIAGDRVLIATPGIPDLPVSPPSLATFGQLRTVHDSDGSAFAVVRHRIWSQPGRYVESFSSREVLSYERRRLVIALTLAGIVLVPLAALGGRVVAGRALRPLDKLVESIRALDSNRLEERLMAPGAGSEIRELNVEFNFLLDRLEESVAAMRRFTADASHALRTPISILRTGLEVSLRRERTPEEYQETMRQNLAEIERVQRIVEGLLALARSHPGESEKLSHATVDFSTVVADVLEATEPLARERQIEVDSEVTPAVQVRGEEGRLHLVVLNLLDNALKFTPRGKRVQVRLEAEDDHARFVVRDEGAGIGERDRDRIFDRFYRGASRPPATTSTGGIGLSVVQWVVDGHGGTVSLLQTGEMGSTFEVRLPLVEESRNGLGVDDLGSAEQDLQR